MASDNLMLVGQTSVIKHIALRNSTTGQLLSGKIHSDFTGWYNIAGAAEVTLSFSSGAVGDAYMSGKLVPLGHGRYAWHVPNAVFASVGSVSANLTVSGAIDVHLDWEVVAVDRNTAAFGANTTAPSTPTNVSDVQTAVLAKLPSSLTANGNMKSSLLEIITTAIAEGVAGRIAAAWQGFWNVASPVATAQSVNQTGDSFARIGAAGVNLTAADDATLAAIAALNNLSSAQVTAAVPTTSQIAAAVDVALINTGDGSDLLQAIANQIAADWVAGDASPLAIVTAMKNDATIAQMIARIDAATTTRASQASVDDVPTNAELATALIAADDAVLAAIALVQSDTGNIQTRLPAALESGRMSAVLDSAARVRLDASQPDYAPAREPALRGGLTLTQAVDLLVASGIGVSSQPSATEEKFKFRDAADAFTTTFDVAGNRVSVVLH